MTQPITETTLVYTLPSSTKPLSVAEGTHTDKCGFFLTAREGWPLSLKSLSLPELSAVLEKCVGEMGKEGEDSAHME